jgi:hypothetical protein
LIELLAGAFVFSHAPHEQVGEREDPTNAGGGMQNRDVLSVRHVDRGDVAYVIDAEAGELAGLEGVARRGESLEHVFEPVDGRAALLLPGGPVGEQAVAEHGAVVGLEALPDLARAEHVGRAALGDIDVTGRSPVVAGGVPQREAAVDLGVEDEAGVGGAAGTAGPCLALAVELADVLIGLGGAVEVELDRGLAGIAGPGHEPGDQAVIDLGGPGAGEGPPGDVEEEAFA